MVSTGSGRLDGGLDCGGLSGSARKCGELEKFFRELDHAKKMVQEAKRTYGMRMKLIVNQFCIPLALGL